MANPITKTFPVTGLGCASCVKRVEDALISTQGVVNVSVSLASNSAQIEYDPDILSTADLQKIVKEAGYELIVTQKDAFEEAESVQKKNIRSLRDDTLIAAVVALIVFLLSSGLSFVPKKELSCGVLAAVSVFYLGRRFLAGAFTQLKHKNANMDTLVSLSTLVSLLSGNFMSATMIVAFILVGRFLEEKSKYATSSNLRSLRSLQPSKVYAVGEEMTLCAGDCVPVDGTVISGDAELDESMLTGESLKVRKIESSPVYSGTFVLSGTINVRADKSGADTLLSKIIAMVQDAQNAKPKIQRTVDKVASVFVPVIICIAVAAFLGWLVFAPDEGLSAALDALVAVLVIACPCSLGLATPTAIVTAVGRAAKDGVLIKDPDAMQNAGSVDAVVFDKTGTLTEGVSSNDRRRESSREAVDSLKSIGVEVHILSGDSADRVERLASELGIDNAVSEVLPDGKAEYIKKLKDEGNKVAMVGDGINDTAAMAYADFSVALGCGSDIAVDSAMAVIMSEDMKKVPYLVRLSRKFNRIVKENLFWAFIYNLIAVPFAALGIIHPMAGAACMAMSSVCVVCNSLRLRRHIR